MDIKNDNYCRCEKIELAHTDFDDFKRWDVCNTCGKVIEDSIVYFNHYDCEDNDYDGSNE